MNSDGTAIKLLGVAAASAAASSFITYTIFRWQRTKERREEAPAGVSTPIRNSGSQQPLLDHFISSPPPLTEAPTAPRDPYDPRPRSGYLSWDDYFMAVAFLSAQRSKDPAKQVGACIVNQNKVICGIGYNGFPRGCSDSELPWAKRSRSGDPLETKYPYVCHAEMNAILNKNGASVAGCSVYVTMFPCNECAKLLIQAGVSEIVFHEDKAQPRSETPGAFKLAQQYSASKKLLALAGVRVRQHVFQRHITLNLSNHPSATGIMTTTTTHPQINGDGNIISPNGTPTSRENGALAMDETSDSIIFNFVSPGEGTKEVGEVDPALQAVLRISENGESENTAMDGSVDSGEGNDQIEVADSGGAITGRPDLVRRSVSAKILLFENIQYDT